MNHVQARDSGPETRLDRRSRRRLQSRTAILRAASELMAEQGIGETTMAEISDRADVALGSVYNHFDSKDALANAVVDLEIDDVAQSIVEQTAGFADPAMVFAFGCRTVIQHATSNDRWRQLLDSPDVVAERFRTGFGPYATHDLRRAVAANRLPATDVELSWRLTTWAIIGACTAMCSGEVAEDALDDVVVAILGVAGMSADEARQLVVALPVRHHRSSRHEAQ